MAGSKVEVAALVDAVIALAHFLHLEVTTEGVQTQEQASRLQALGCGQGQEYYFSRSLPSKGVGMLLQSACSLGRLAL
ncbi:MAG: EAL domain-containing protein [Chloroflexota bacterium]|nr:EAL domain-containing protein [Chloroflexota bacterium]